MPRKPIKDHRRILNMRERVTTLVVNLIEDKVVAEERSNRHPEFLQETMFEEHGTRVLITNPAADQYLNDKDESEAFKADALDNYEKHYGDSKKKLRDMWKNNYES